MSEPRPESFKPIVLVLWVALATAIIVTIIDWKIKQDILRISDAFYRTSGGFGEQNSAGSGSNHSSPVLPVPRVDTDSRMEAENVPFDSHGDDNAAAWAKWLNSNSATEPGTAENSD